MLSIPAPWPERLSIVSRALAAIVDGYALAALCSVALALLLPLARSEAVTWGMLASFRRVCGGGAVGFYRFDCCARVGRAGAGLGRGGAAGGVALAGLDGAAFGRRRGMKNGFRQSMAWLHTWSGLLVGWVLFWCLRRARRLTGGRKSRFG